MGDGKWVKMVLLGAAIQTCHRTARQHRRTEEASAGVTLSQRAPCPPLHTPVTGAFRDPDPHGPALPRAQSIGGGGPRGPVVGQ